MKINSSNVNDVLAVLKWCDVDRYLECDYTEAEFVQAVGMYVKWLNENRNRKIVDNVAKVKNIDYIEAVKDTVTIEKQKG